jgi:two-component system OmpR family sensor kinase
MKLPRSLAGRMLAIALAQMSILAIAAIAIFYLTRPDHGGGGPPGGPGHGPPPGLRVDRGPPDHGPPDRGPPDHAAPLGPWLTLAVGFVVLGIGAVLTARWIVRPIGKIESIASAIGHGDLTARSGLARDDELGRLAKRIDEMAEQIQQMLSHERELLANVAHELRTPLSRIGVALDLAGEGDGERARTSLGEIAVDIAELEVIVDDVLTALRYDVTRGASMPLRRERTAPDAIAAAAAERMRARHPERPLEVSIAPALPDLDVDPVLFRRVIDNLLENSHKYTPERTSPILLAVRPGERRVEFEVVDRGIGIATADMPNIYHSFFRAERSRSRETGGVGLGLTLAKRIVEAHGGAIEITSSVGKGTRARVCLPAAGDAATSACSTPDLLGP